MPTLTTCTACGCTCDDIRLADGNSGALQANTHGCQLGERWFAEPSIAGPVAMIAGKPATLDEAIARATEILASAKLPLVTGLQHATIEAIRAAVRLADQIGGCVDWTANESDAASTLALQTAGGVTASLGEVAQRADVVIVWGVDLAASHPRHFERYSLEPSSPWIEGRDARTLVAINDSKTETAKRADEAMEIAEDSDYEALSVLRALLAGFPLDAEQVQQQTGVSLNELQSLLERMKQAKYGAVIYGGTLSTSSEATVALTQLMADLTSHTRWVAVPAGGPGNKAGAVSVLTWQTGYPLGVNFAQGYPQYGPGEWTTAELLARGEADAALVVGGDLPVPSIPTIVLDWRDTPAMQNATVAIRTARPGVECSGTTQRVDGVMLPLRAVRSTERPTTEDVLRQIVERNSFR